MDATLDLLARIPILRRLWHNRVMPLNHFLTVKEAAERLGVGIQRVYDLIDAGRLEVHRSGGRIFIHERDLKNIKPGKGKGGRPRKDKNHT